MAFDIAWGAVPDSVVNYALEGLKNLGSYAAQHDTTARIAARGAVHGISVIATSDDKNTEVVKGALPAAPQKNGPTVTG